VHEDKQDNMGKSVQCNFSLGIWREPAMKLEKKGKWESIKIFFPK